MDRHDRGFLRFWLVRRGVGVNFLFLLPCWHVIPPSRGVWGACAAGAFAFPAGARAVYCPAGTGGSPSGEVGTPARRAARWGRLWGYAPFSAPLASPPKHPLRGAFNFLSVARARVLCCGSFLPSLRSLRRSPSATRKCQSPRSLWQSPFQPNTANISDFQKYPSVYSPLSKTAIFCLFQAAIKSGSWSHLP